MQCIRDLWFFHIALPSPGAPLGFSSGAVSQLAGSEGWEGRMYSIAHALIPWSHLKSAEGLGMHPHSLL